MATTAETQRIYEELATLYDRQGQARMRDWFLVLAADAAVTAGRPNDAERLRQQLLGQNPHHLLKPFVSFAEALKSPDIRGYVADLKTTYPPETAEQMLQTQRAQAPLFLDDEVGLSPLGGEAPPPAQPALPPATVKVSRQSHESIPLRVEFDPEPPRTAKPALRVQPEPIGKPTGPMRVQPVLDPEPISTGAPEPPPTARLPGTPPPIRLAEPTGNIPLPLPAPSLPATVRTPRGAAPAVLPLPRGSYKQDAEFPPSKAVTFLFALAVLGGLAATAYVLGRPFLPADWLP